MLATIRNFAKVIKHLLKLFELMFSFLVGFTLFVDFFFNSGEL